MAQLTPRASAPPAGSVLATADEPRLTTAAWRSRIDGSTAQIAIQPVSRLAAVAAASSSAWPHVIASMVAHTLRYDASRGSANPNVAPMSATVTATRRIFRPRRDRVVAGGATAPGPQARSAGGSA